MGWLRWLSLVIAAVDPIWVQAGATVAVAFVSAGSGWALARRTTSGNISTSDAATLWDEAEQIRKELRDEVKELRAEIRELRSEVNRVTQENVGLRERNQALERGRRTEGDS